MDLRHLGAVGERLAVAGRAGLVRVDHRGVPEDHGQRRSVAEANHLPGLVSPEFGERETTGHANAVEGRACTVDVTLQMSPHGR
jgi:hypothetical protein